MIVKIELLDGNDVKEYTIFNFSELWKATRFYRAIMHWCFGLKELLER